MRMPTIPTTVAIRFRLRSATTETTAWEVPSSARWLPTWNLGARWNIANEKFMENAEKVDVMGLRLSYGLSANTGLATNSSVVYRYNEVYRPEIPRTAW